MDNLDKYPKFNHTQPLECVAKSGDMLFIPAHWWHAVFGDGESCSVTTFLDAALHHWAFPTPTARVWGGIAFNKLINSGVCAPSGCRDLPASSPRSSALSPTAARSPRGSRSRPRADQQALAGSATPGYRIPRTGGGLCVLLTDSRAPAPRCSRNPGKHTDRLTSEKRTRPARQCHSFTVTRTDGEHSALPDHQSPIVIDVYRCGTRSERHAAVRCTRTDAPSSPPCRKVRTSAKGSVPAGSRCTTIRAACRPSPPAGAA